MKATLIDPECIDLDPDDLATVRENAEEELAERLAGTAFGEPRVTVCEAEEWHSTLCDIIDRLLAGRPFELRTSTECCAFTTVIEEADIPLRGALDDQPEEVVLPECAAPLCAFADYDEYRIVEDDDEDDFDDCPPIRHSLRAWRVTVTLEQVIDSSFHPCDPDICPLEVTLRKRVIFKQVIARTRCHAQELTLDLFEAIHKVREGAEYGAEAVLIAEPTVETGMEERRCK